MKRLVMAIVILLMSATISMATRMDFEGVITSSDTGIGVYPRVSRPFTGYFEYKLSTAKAIPDSTLFQVETAFEFNFENTTVYKEMGYGVYADLNDMVFLDYPSDTSPDYFVEDWYTSLGPDGGSFLMVAGTEGINAHIYGSFTRVGTANQPVPEPATVLLMGVGLALASGHQLRKRYNKNTN